VRAACLDLHQAGERLAPAWPDSPQAETLPNANVRFQSRAGTLREVVTAFLNLSPAYASVVQAMVHHNPARSQIDQAVRNDITAPVANPAVEFGSGPRCGKPNDR
jgi:hypothetical protein